MFTHLLTRMRSAFTRLAISCCSLGFACPCLADAFDRLDQYMTGYQQLNITPIQLMDDNALLAAAETRRNGRMCDQVRRLNSQWLLQTEHNTWTGTPALRKLLKHTFFYLWDWRKARSLKAEDYSPNKHQQEHSRASYVMNLSEDEAVLSIKLRF